MAFLIQKIHLISLIVYGLTEYLGAKRLQLFSVKEVKTRGVCSECNKALSIMRYEDDIYTEHNMKTVCREAVAQWKERLTRNGYTRVQITKGAYF